MKHKIDYHEMMDHTFFHLMAASHGRGENKKLEAKLHSAVVAFRVWNHRELVLETFSLKRAVETYNEL